MISRAPTHIFRAIDFISSWRDDWPSSRLLRVVTETEF